ncbi:hypothetical protein FJU31_06080 [Stenotrophomonas cyclobalanopsidis]|uniref:Uncharacterized protein n=1 Tax=Stenotrophomonas cyclobalanopsidis TaxID=2771362 RepID=A0ABQ6T305_9GAMM|nr:hypothetical protein [Stenotrophomonas cyclobalanopsidis]KAA9001521.1 hypothetical protein FJU31_06080 [Stenotrophomonas cyclobalanopsidis]
MSIDINAATNPCGQDICGPPTTTRLFCQRHRFQLRQIKAPAIIQHDGSQSPAARNECHAAANLDALFDLSFPRQSSTTTSQRHAHDRNTPHERDPKAASSWVTQPNGRDASR